MTGRVCEDLNFTVWKSQILVSVLPTTSTSSNLSMACSTHQEHLAPLRSCKAQGHRLSIGTVASRLGSAEEACWEKSLLRANLLCNEGCQDLKSATDILRRKENIRLVIEREEFWGVP